MALLTFTGPVNELAELVNMTQETVLRFVELGIVLPTVRPMGVAPLLAICETSLIVPKLFVFVLVMQRRSWPLPEVIVPPASVIVELPAVSRMPPEAMVVVPVNTIVTAPCWH